MRATYLIVVQASHMGATNTNWEPSDRLGAEQPTESRLLHSTDMIYTSLWYVATQRCLCQRQRRTHGVNDAQSATMGSMSDVSG